LAGKARAPSRKDINADFPMRGFLACGDCHHPMTATWATGSKGGRYPYYLCRQRSCASSGKSVARAKVEEALESLVRSLTPARELADLASSMFRDLWDKRAMEGKERRTALKLEKADVERKISQFLDRIVDADSPTVIGAYERRIGKLERDKLILAENIAKCGTPARDYDEVFQTAMTFLANPWNLWETGALEDRRAMLKLVFAGNLIFARKTGFQTPEISLPFKALEDFSSQKRGMARPAGFEPATPSLEGSCSVQLSYGRVGAS
jgi:site-specific DNA recombinase